MCVDACALLSELLSDSGLHVEGDERGAGEKRAGVHERTVVRSNQPDCPADGATWIWEIARTCFPSARQILDYYHAHEYLSQITTSIFGKDSPASKRGIERWKKMLFEDRIVAVIKEMRRKVAKLTLSDEEHKQLEGKIGYLDNNKERMLYGTYKASGYFYGSGVVEAGCKTVIGKRAKQSSVNEQSSQECSGPPGEPKTS